MDENANWNERRTTGADPWDEPATGTPKSEGGPSPLSASPTVDPRFVGRGAPSRRQNLEREIDLNFQLAEHASRYMHDRALGQMEAALKLDPVSDADRVWVENRTFEVLRASAAGEPGQHNPCR